jgi:Domain of Unknown Function (DUF1080)
MGRSPSAARASAVVRGLAAGLVLLVGGGPAAAPWPAAAPVSVIGSAAAQSAASATEAQRWTFEEASAGDLPAGAQVFSGSWAVRAEADAPSPPNALCQTGQAEFPALALGDAVYADLTMSARFKPISGSVDQAAGLLFRIQDQANYYILRANALEGNVNLYLYRDAHRSLIKEGSAQVAGGQWQELRLEAQGNHFRGYLDGRPVVEATDDTYQAGQVGLWTKADSVTCFDDVEARPLT